MLQNYLFQDPLADEVLVNFVEGLGRPAFMWQEILRVLEGVIDSNRAVKIIEDFYSSWESWWRRE